MNLLNKLRILLFIVPFILILGYLWILNDIRTNRWKYPDWMMEDSLNHLLHFMFSDVHLWKYQTVRILTSLLITIPFILLKHHWIYPILIFLVCYKIFYIYLSMQYKQKMKIMNQELPYMMKSIIYLSYVYPIHTALYKSVDYVPDVYRQDLLQLVHDIDDNPNSYQPYDSFSKRYDYKLNSLDFYLRMLYRLSMSSKQEEHTLLNYMNRSISDNLNQTRSEKNKQVNEVIQYLGLLPVILVTIMLTYLLLKISGL